MFFSLDKKNKEISGWNKVFRTQCHCVLFFVTVTDEYTKDAFGDDPFWS